MELGDTDIKDRKKEEKKLGLNLMRQKKDIQIIGIKQPKVIMALNQDYIAVKETVNNDRKKNIAILFPNGNTNKVIVGNENDIADEITYQLGGSDYYAKYMKYKAKYLRLKALSI